MANGILEHTTIEFLVNLLLKTKIVSQYAYMQANLVDLMTETFNRKNNKL